MKIHVPADHQQAFSKALTLARLLEQGEFAEAFDSIQFSPEAHESAKQWSRDLEYRRAVLQRCELRISLGGYKAQPEALARLTSLLAQTESDGDFAIVIHDAEELKALCDALEAFARLSMAQISDVLTPFTTIYGKPGVRPEDGSVIDEMYHQGVTECGASFGILGKHVSDDARNAWNAKKLIDWHESEKRPLGKHQLYRLSKPLKVGQASPYSIVIDDTAEQTGSPLADYDPAFSRLNDFIAEERGWDGLDGKPATRATAACVEGFLHLARASGFTRPSLTLNNTGAVSVIWKSKTHYVTATFKDDKPYSLIVLENGKSVLSSTSPIRNLPDELRSHLVSNFSYTAQE